MDSRDCPKCRQDLVETELEGIPLDYCRMCDHGFADRFAVHTWVERRTAKIHDAGRLEDLMPVSAAEAGLCCPACSSAMRRSTDDAIDLDFCPDCSTVRISVETLTHVRKWKRRNLRRIARNISQEGAKDVVLRNRLGFYAAPWALVADAFFLFREHNRERRNQRELQKIMQRTEAH
ncbi:hypothetical protein ABI59_15990 [Acidobacteria bacterium Mor1]|nr:hypothetical protein ABI59_15990 [Acidobacteria bacterium Mor1]